MKISEIAAWAIGAIVTAALTIVITIYVINTIVSPPDLNDPLVKQRGSSLPHDANEIAALAQLRGS